MKAETDRYSFAELKFFYGVLDDALRASKTRNRRPSVQDMLTRLFACADKGERDPQKLKAAILKERKPGKTFRSDPCWRDSKPPILLSPGPDAYQIRMVGRSVSSGVPQAASSVLPPATV